MIPSHTILIVRDFSAYLKSLQRLVEIRFLQILLNQANDTVDEEMRLDSQFNRMQKKSCEKDRRDSKYLLSRFDFNGHDSGGASNPFDAQYSQFFHLFSAIL